MLLKLAWRNIWRNRRRAFITIFSVVFAVSLSVLVQSLQSGIQENLLKNTVGSFLGYIQIHKKAYWQKQNLDYVLDNKKDLQKQIFKHKEIKQLIPRLENYMLLQSKSKSKTARVIGIDIKLEKYISNPKNKIIRGKFFGKNNEKSLILTEGLAKYLKVSVNDSIKIIHQKQIKTFFIKGIVKISKPDLNQTLLYIPLQTSQNLFKLKNHITTLIIIPKKPQKSQLLAQKLQKELKNQNLEVMSWQELTPELHQILLSQNIAGQIIISILYVIVAFGIFETILMMTSERRQELAILLGVGMQIWQLTFVIFLEIILLGLVGVLIGSLIIYPIILYFSIYPIQFENEMKQMFAEVGMQAEIRLKFSFWIIVYQTLIIFIINTLLAFYPFQIIRKLKIVEAINKT